jgi:gamma-glutamyl hercynylcysteine S-oxide synthase
MSFVPEALLAPSLDEPRMRQASADVLSLALIDARNHSLHVAQRIDDALAHCTDQARANSARQVLGERIGHCAKRAANWCQLQWTPAESARLEVMRGPWLELTEQSQDLLAQCAHSDEALAPFRAALELEDRLGQELIRMANTWANAWAESAGSKVEDAAQVWGTDWPAPHAASPRDAIHFGARRWRLGQQHEGGFAWANEQGHSTQLVPEFSIDAQPVSWAQFVEFVDDGGYDRRECWTAAGWTWLQGLSLQAQGRRAPLHVEQLSVASGAVIQRSFGRLARRAGSHAAMHLSHFEAEAFATWVGRRLPTEHEWEIAALHGRAMGFRWGDVVEWTLDGYRESDALPAGAYSARRSDDVPQGHMALRGASFATRSRNKIVNARWHAAPERDEGFTGFRTCSL